MALIGEIITKIKVDASQQKKELTKAKKELLSFGKVAKKALTGLKVGAIGATAALVGVVALVNKTADSIDLLAKTSAKLGITVAALQKLEFQAGLTGVSTEKLSQTLQRMTRGISEAAAGFGTAKKALEELGLSAEVLNKLSPDKSFNLIAKAFKNINNQSDKVRLAMQIFGREGVALVNTMNSNLEETGAKFDALGVSITQSQAKAVEAFNDAKFTLGTLLGGFAQQLTVKLAPAFTFLIDKITSLVVEFGGMGKVAEVVANTILTGMSASVGAITAMVNGIDRLILGYERLALVINKGQTVGAALFAPVLPENFVQEQFNQVVRGESEIARIQKRIADRNKASAAIQSGITGAQGAITQASAPIPLAKLELLVRTDPQTVVEELSKDKKLNKLVNILMREEVSKIGR